MPIEIETAALQLTAAIKGARITRVEQIPSKKIYVEWRGGYSIVIEDGFRISTGGYHRGNFKTIEAAIAASKL